MLQASRPCLLRRERFPNRSLREKLGLDQLVRSWAGDSASTSQSEADRTGSTLSLRDSGGKGRPAAVKDLSGRRGEQLPYFWTAGLWIAQIPAIVQILRHRA